MSSSTRETAPRDHGSRSAEPDPPPAAALTVEARARLLGLARTALRVATCAAPEEALEGALDATADLGIPTAVFVTLTNGLELRGCIGGIDPVRPLARAVAAAAISAARHDPRMSSVTAAELPQIRIGISVLGRAVPLVDPAHFRPGIDGVIVERDGRLALLLPEVAPEFGWGTGQTLEAACRKAGLPAGAWHDPRTRLSRFRTLRFGGPAGLDEGS